MILTLTSNNQQLSYLICKAPFNTRVIPIRKGYSIGWYSQLNQFQIKFIDAPDEVSYPEYMDQEFEYLSLGKFNSPVCALNLISNWFTLSKDPKFDLEVEHTLEIKCVRMKERTYKLIKKYYPQIELNEVCKNNYILKYTRFGRLCDLLNEIELILAVITIENEESFYYDVSFLNKFFKKIQQTHAPYFIRYVLKGVAKPWNKFQDYFQGDGMEIGPFDNFKCRLDWVKSHLDDTDILDIGCGEGRYLTNKVNVYHAVDSDPEVLETAKRRAKNKEFDNVIFYDKLEDVDTTDPVNVILTEVIEHIEQEQLTKFMNKVVKVNWKKIIITTPNSDFNHNYGVESRHEDHKWEVNKEELTRKFYDFLNRHYGDMSGTQFTFGNEYISVNVVDIGDKVNGIATTTGIIIQKNT